MDALPPETSAGLGTLAALKAAVLPSPLAAGTDYDAILITMGQGVLAEFEAYLNRKLVRAEDATYVVPADRTFVCVDRYPLEAVSRVDFLPWGALADGWSEYTDNALNAIYPAAGMVDFGYTYGTSQDQLRVTFTGGYWVDETADGTGQPPAGATRLPADLFRAWTRQVRAEFKADDVAGVGVVRDEKTPTVNPNDQEQFLPAVQAVLDRYRRLAT